MKSIHVSIRDQQLTVKENEQPICTFPVSTSRFGLGTEEGRLDLRLGEVAYRVRASFLPGARHKVRDKLDLLSMHCIDLTQGAVLEKDCVYIVPLLEYVALRKRTSAAANPKSSTGRLDVFARVITDYGTEFDRVREGYKGPLFAEISPRAFSILVRTGKYRADAVERSGVEPTAVIDSVADLPALLDAG